MDLIKRIRSEDRGGVIVFVALSMAVMISSMALAIDIGLLLTARSEAQRAADAIALAGASAFLSYDPISQPAEADSAARDRLYEIALANAVRSQAIDSAEVTPQILLDSAIVRVNVRREAIPLWFARLFGVNMWDVEAHAAAEAALAGNPVDCVKPLMIPNIWTELSDDEGGSDDVNDNKIWDFDIDYTCTNQNNCDNEVWQFDDGDVYEPEVSGYGTGYRDAVQDTTASGNVVNYTGDHGRRIPLKIQSAQLGNVTSHWYPWVIPGSSNSGAAGYVENLLGCVPVEQLVAVGEEVEFDLETKNGLMPVPTKNAIDSLVNTDPNAYWDEDQQQVMYRRPDGSTYFDTDWEKSGRVFTVAIFNPVDMRSGKQYYEIVDFARFFLENPDEVYPEITPDHKRPVTGRLLKYARGEVGPEQGTLIRVLRLIE